MATVDIGAGKWLDAEAAASWARCVATGCPSQVTSAGRSAAEQQRLRDLYLAGKGAFALPPEASKHVAGLALDLPWGGRTWMRANGAAHGWSGVPNEDWHFEYTPSNDTHKETPMDPIFAARLAEIVEWQRKQFEYQNKRLDEVVAWMDRKFAGLDATAPEPAGADETAEAILAKLKERL